MTAPALARSTATASGVAWSVRRRLLPAILLGYVALGLAWSFSIPLGEGPDEPAHFDYALFLQREGRLPVRTEQFTSSDVSGEAHQPPLAYLLMQPLIAWWDGSPTLPPLYDNSDFRWSGGQQPNAYLHGVAERPPYRGIVLVWRLVRLLSLALGLVSIPLCYATVRAIWPDLPDLALGAAALVAFNPQWLFHHALVSNDPLLIALSSALIYLAVVAARGNRPYSLAEGDTAPRLVRDGRMMPILAGLTLGLMLLTKQSALALFPLPLLGLFLGRASLGQWLRQSLVVVAVAALLGGWWYVRNWSLYGDPMGLETFQESFGGGVATMASWQTWSEGGWNLLRSSWGLFGWMTVPLPIGAYYILRATLAVALAGLLAGAGSDLWRGRGHAAIVLLAALGLVGGWIVVFALSTRNVAWPGRFIFPAAPALAALLAVGLWTVLPRRGLLVLAVLSLISAAALPGGLIRPLYASPALREADVPKGGPYARFDFGWRRGIELHDASFNPVARTGATVPISLTWHLVEPMDRPYVVFIHLVDAQETIVAKSDAPPLGGRLPVDAWVPGDWFRDEQRLSLAGVAPDSYRLIIGFFDPEEGDRVQVYSPGGRLRGDTVDLGEFRVEP